MTNKGKMALLVEDNPIQAKMAIRILESMGFEVEHTTTGEAAVELFKTNHYHFGMFDIGLDGALRGDQAVAQIRKEETGDRCLIFAVTAHVSDEAIAQYKAAGIDQVFEKPIKKEVIVEAFNQLSPQ